MAQKIMCPTSYNLQFMGSKVRAGTGRDAWNIRREKWVQSWALSVFLNSFNNKNDFIAFLSN